MAGHPVTVLGRVTEDAVLHITDGHDDLVHLETQSMVEAWQATLAMGGAFDE